MVKYLADTIENIVYGDMDNVNKNFIDNIEMVIYGTTKGFEDPKMGYCIHISTIMYFKLMKAGAKRYTGMVYSPHSNGYIEHFWVENKDQVFTCGFDLNSKYIRGIISKDIYYSTQKVKNQRMLTHEENCKQLINLFEIFFQMKEKGEIDFEIKKN